MLNNNIDHEEWEEVRGYWGKYLVSNHGRIYNTFRCKLLKQTTHKKSPYPRVNLSNEDETKTLYVHRIVAEYFVPNICDLPWVNHLDEDPENNHHSNLEWCTPTDNANHGTRNARLSASEGQLIEGIKKRKKYGIKVKGTSLKDGEVIELESMNQATKYGFDQGSISACCRGKRNKHKGYTWEYI